MNFLSNTLRQLERDKSGVASVVTALSAIVLVGFSAGAVDFGSVFLKTRQLQGMTDLAAMAAASNVAQAQAAATATAQANNFGAVTAVAQTGIYTPSEAIPVSSRFAAGGSSPNAARVTLNGQAPLYFASLFLGKTSLPISRTATAARAELADFSIGTRLVSLQGGVENSILSALTGSSVSLSAVDYNSLASTQVNLFQYTNALKSRANITAGSYDDTLSSNVTASQALTAISDVLSSNAQSNVAAPMRIIAQAADSTPVNVGQIVNLGPYGGQDYTNSSGGSGVSVSALDLACAVLQLAQGGRQLQFNLNINSPGMMSATAWLAIGQRPANSPWIAVTDSGDVIVRTAQARLYIDAKVAPTSVIPGVASIDVPMLVEAAEAQAKLASVTCGATARTTRWNWPFSPASATRISARSIWASSTTSIRRSPYRRPTWSPCR